MRPARFVAIALQSLACNDGASVLGPPDTGPDVVAVDASVDVSVDAPADVVADVPSDAPVDCGDAGLLQCRQACADPKTDAKNCGFCGHDCGTGACAEGMCPIETLATGREFPYGIAVDATSFYVTDSGDQTTFTGGDVLVCPLAGCPTNPTPITTNLSNPGDIAVDATSVYWLNRGGIASAGGTLMKCPLAGCGANNVNRVTLVKNVTFPAGLVLDAKNAYFNDFGPKPFFSGITYSCALAGCLLKPTSILTGLNLPNSTAVSATKVYVAAGGGTKIVEGLLSASGAGTVDETDMTAAYASVNLSGTSLLWSDGNNGTVRSCNTTNCNANSKAVVQNLQSPGPLARDSQGLYIIDQGAGPNTAAILYCADVQSCTTPIVLADKLDTPTAIALGAGYVYWTNMGATDNTGTVLRVAR